MDQYVPIEEVSIADVVSSDIVGTAVDRFHLQLSATEVAFTKSQQEKTVILTNVGFDPLRLRKLVNVNSKFKIDQALPSQLLSGKSYPIRITFDNDNQTAQAGGIYIDVGDSYGEKFIKLTGLIS